MEVSGGSSPVLPDHLWHHRIHEELGERLYFWRLGFSPVYPRDSALAGLEAALVRWDVKSVAVYELFGPFDVLVRVWLPESCEALRFQETLIDELEPHGLSLCDVFSVDYVVRHWAFEEKNGSDEPRVQFVRDLIEDEERINSLELGTLGYREVEEMRNNHLVATPSFKDHRLPGIKFALIVTGRSAEGEGGTAVPGGPDAKPRLEGDDRRDFQELVTSVVARAKSIEDRSLYAGSGFGHFVILGRVGYKKFHDIHSMLVTQLGAARFRDRFRVGTETMVSGQRGMRIFTEQLIRPPFVVGTPNVDPGLDLERLAPGTRVISERFRIEESLGKGGFGSVYKVTDLVDEGMVWALKLFPAASSHAGRREMEMLRKVSSSSEHVVHMVWGGRDVETGWWYLVSEFIEGTTLDVYVHGRRAGELSDAQSLDVVRQILLGLEAVHPKDVRMDELARINDERDLTAREWKEWQELKEQGVIHRDIKPLNVMITPEGLVKLIDFNIASPAGSERDTVTSTRPYAPPGGWVDRVWAPRVDLFAVGVVLYELLCHGHHPYPADLDEPVNPAVHRPDLPEPLLDILRRACTVSGCYSRAVEMREDLERTCGQREQ